MAQKVIFEHLSDRFDPLEKPPWYDDAVLRLRGGGYRSYGLYLYNFILQSPTIQTVVNIGTGRGFSAVCAARALENRDNGGMVHTIDVRSPDEPRHWHRSGQADDDPAKGVKLSVHDLIEPFHLDHGTLPIEHHQGDSIDVLTSWEGDNIDLTFHDGRHTYRHVKGEIDLSVRQNELGTPVLIFDDCFLYQNEWTKWFASDGGAFEFLNSLPYLRRLPEYALVRKRFAGVSRAVTEAFDDGSWSRLEVVEEDWAPITALLP